MTPDLKDRQRRAGYALYESLGIGRRDVSGRRKQFAKNYAFFGAPVGVVVTIERAMGKGCFMDLGMAIMAFFLGAEDEGFGTTGIGALANYGPIVHEHLNLPEDEMVRSFVACHGPGILVSFRNSQLFGQPVSRLRHLRVPVRPRRKFRLLILQWLAAIGKSSKAQRHS
ncbi:Chloronitrobenzene nitroreductase [Nymphon striatum]|nr:Chloronitrobenzene nitroreductase [Nymphon striatum]